MFKYNFLLLLCLYTVCFADRVVELTDNNFHNELKDHETALVMFYAPWCGHCKKLKPEYAEAAEDLIYHDPPIVLGKADCTGTGKLTCDRYNVDSYPTLKIFRKGHFEQDYAGPRDSQGIVKYMIGALPTQLASLDDLEHFFENHSIVCVVGHFGEESDLKTEFMKVAEGFTDVVKFGILQKEGANEIVLYRPLHLRSLFEDYSVTYEGKANETAIKVFIKDNYHGLVGHRTYSNTEDFQMPLIVAYYNVNYKKNAKGTNYWRNRILKIAAVYRSKVNFAISAINDFETELDGYGITNINTTKPVVVATSAKKQKFAMQDAFSSEAFEAFINDFLDGKLTPYIKSEPIPESNDGAVKVAVALNFEQVVTNSGKDTFIKFYAPWCGHCKNLAPVYEQLGEKMKDEDVEIVKVNADGNDAPGEFEVRGYPTLYWVSKGAKPEVYDGGRKLEDFIKFIAEHATDELKGFDRKGNPKAAKTEL